MKKRILIVFGALFLVVNVHAQRNLYMFNYLGLNFNLQGSSEVKRAEISSFGFEYNRAISSHTSIGFSYEHLYSKNRALIDIAQNTNESMSIYLSEGNTINWKAKYYFDEYDDEDGLGGFYFGSGLDYSNFNYYLEYETQTSGIPRTNEINRNFLRPNVMLGFNSWSQLFVQASVHLYYNIPIQNNSAFEIPVSLNQINTYNPISYYINLGVGIKL